MDEHDEAVVPGMATSGGTVERLGADLENLANCCTGSVLCGCFADGLHVSLRLVERAMEEVVQTPEVEYVWEKLTATVTGVDKRRGDGLAKLYAELHGEAPLF